MVESGQKRILIVDDHEANRSLLREHVAMSGCEPVLASDGLEALDELHASAPDLVILDLLLPRLDGVSVLRKLRANPDLQRIPVVVISAASETTRIRECIELGADDFLPKPFKTHALLSRIDYCLARNRRSAEDAPPFRAREFARQIISSIDLLGIATSNNDGDWSSGLFRLVEQYTPETRTHLSRTSRFCRALTEELARNRKLARVITDTFIEDFARASALHDIGKLAVPDAILNKPGALDAEEHRVMRRHVTVGAEILRELYHRFPQETRFELAIELTLYHHERWDGFGYPYGLSGDAIPLAGRIMAVADVYDALRSERCYKTAFSHEMSREIILAGSGKQFDPCVVAGFLACEHELQEIFDGCEAGAPPPRPVRPMQPVSLLSAAHALTA